MVSILFLRRVITGCPCGRNPFDFAQDIVWRSWRAGTEKKPLRGIAGILLDAEGGCWYSS